MIIFKLVKRAQLKRVRNAIENKIADILEHIDNNERVDKVEEQLIKTGIRTAAAEFGTAIPEVALDYIAKKVVKGIGRINKALQKQLRKEG